MRKAGTIRGTVCIMPVTIAGAPTPVSRPGFGGIVIHVPLSEAPTPAWLDLLATKDLPGKGHRVQGAGLEFCLDRDARDVIGAMRKIAEAVRSVNQAYDPLRDEIALKAAQAEERRVASTEKITRQLAEWWAAHAPPELTERPGQSRESL